MKTEKAPNMKRWSDQKLDMELTFAECAKDDGHPETGQWLALLNKELIRRSGVSRAA